jgi:hypothetical protein
MSRNRFTAVPDVPTTVAAEWESQMLDALKQNVELLSGLRGETDKASQAVVKGMITIEQVPRPLYNAVPTLTVRGEGFTISGVQVASFVDYGRLITDVAALSVGVQQLAVDLQNTRDAVDVLIRQMKG